jgi:hypothetical protein
VSCTSNGLVMSNGDVDTGKNNGVWTNICNIFLHLLMKKV